MRSRFGSGSLTQVWIKKIRSEMTCSVSQKVDTEMGQAPTSQARPRQTDHLRSSNFAARTLRSVEHTPSKSGHDPCPERRGVVATVKCSVRKTRFVRCPGRLWNITQDARALCGFQLHKGENVLCVLFSEPIIVGLSTNL